MQQGIAFKYKQHRSDCRLQTNQSVVHSEGSGQGQLLQRLLRQPGMKDEHRVAAARLPRRNLEHGKRSSGISAEKPYCQNGLKGAGGEGVGGLGAVRVTFLGPRHKSSGQAVADEIWARAPGPIEEPQLAEALRQGLASDLFVGKAQLRVFSRAK